jgi:CheY-like chemotaxis protein
MPDLDGVETVKRMRLEDAQSVPAVVMVTAFGRDVVLRRATTIDVSLQSVLTKPVTPSLLLEAVNIALGREQVVQRTLARRTDAVKEVSAKLAGARLLLVEDNALNQELAVELLRQEGVACEVADNGQQALDWLARDKAFDGVLMDCQMPVMDGYTATRQIRQNPAFDHLPIIAMTANALLGDKEKALAAGMNDHIAKPINVLDMFTTLAHLITPLRASNTPATKPPQDTQERVTLPELPGIDIARGMATVMGNVRLYRRLLQRFRQDYLGFADRFLKALDDADPQAALRCAHTLKGVAANLGALRVQSCATALEHACATGAQAPVISAMMMQTVQALQPVLQGLQSLQDNAVQGKDPGPIDYSALQTLCVHLQLQLANSDADAVQGADALAQELIGSPWQPLAKRINRHAEQFEFDQAAQLLSTLQSELQQASSV